MNVRKIIRYCGMAAAAAVLLMAHAQDWPGHAPLPLPDSLRDQLTLTLALADSGAPVSANVWKAPMLLPEPDHDTTASDQWADLARQMGDFASNYLGTRYRLGATGPKAFDCSGFMRHIYNNFGLKLNRTSRQQYTQGETVDLADVKPGDLLFFSGRRVSKRVGHVGMVTSVDPVTGEVEMIHASSSKGIAFQKFPDGGYFSRRFLGARRILGTEGFEPAGASGST